MTHGGRVLSVVATGPELDVAAERAHDAAGSIAFAGRQMRRDIARLPVRLLA